MFSRLTNSLKPHHDPSFTVDFDQRSVRSASSVISGVVHLHVDEAGGAGGSGRKAFEEVHVKFRAVQVSLGNRKEKGVRKGGWRGQEEVKLSSHVRPPLTLQHSTYQLFRPQPGPMGLSSNGKSYFPIFQCLARLS